MKGDMEKIRSIQERIFAYGQGAWAVHILYYLLPHGIRLRTRLAQIEKLYKKPRGR
jgi:hypothetical protein